MKKFLAVFFSVFLLNGCDDGDVKVATINFDQVTAVKCSDNEIIYKLNGNEVLLLSLASDPFDNNPGVKTPIQIGASNQVRYRLYSGPASADNICSNIQPATPIVTEEWIATSGTVEVTTTQVLSPPDALTGATTIDHYNHNIIFRDIIFEKPDGNLVYETFIFGDYATASTALAFDFDPLEVMACPATNTIYNARLLGKEALFIQNFDSSLLATDLPNLNVPKTRPVSDPANKLIYRTLKTQFALGAHQVYFCSGATIPETDQEWIATSGDIEVTTTAESAGFRHIIRLKNVIFKNGNSSFYYGNDILYGELEN